MDRFRGAGDRHRVLRFRTASFHGSGLQGDPTTAQPLPSQRHFPSNFLFRLAPFIKNRPTYFYFIFFRKEECTADSRPEYLSLNLWLFVGSQLLTGAGAAPLYTLGVTYLDENVTKKMSSVYLGISFVFPKKSCGPRSQSFALSFQVYITRCLWWGRRWDICSAENF